MISSKIIEWIVTRISIYFLYLIAAKKVINIIIPHFPSIYLAHISPVPFPQPFTDFFPICSYSDPKQAWAFMTRIR